MTGGLKLEKLFSCCMLCNTCGKVDVYALRANIVMNGNAPVVKSNLVNFHKFLGIISNHPMISEHQQQPFRRI